jgi:hypothetical protein
MPHFDGEISLEILARKNIDIGVAGKIAEMAGDGRGLDELHERISRRLGHMFSEMLEHGRPIRLHADGLDKGFDEAGMCCALRTRSLSPADISMMKCLPHMTDRSSQG